MRRANDTLGASRPLRSNTLQHLLRSCAMSLRIAPSLHHWILRGMHAALLARERHTLHFVGAPFRAGTNALGGRFIMKYTRMLILAMVAGFVAQAGALSRPINEPRDPPNCERTAALAYCRYAGPDPQIVLMTGLGNAMQSWQPSLLEALSRFAGVIVYDRRGHGASAPLPQEPVTAQAAAADLNALLESL